MDRYQVYAGLNFYPEYEPAGNLIGSYDKESEAINKAWLPDNKGTEWTKHHWSYIIDTQTGVKNVIYGLGKK
jgi:hypothetical protein